MRAANVFICGLFLVSIISFVARADSSDCAPAGHLPGYVAGTKQTHEFSSHEFEVQKGDDKEAVQVEGRVCEQAYSIEPDHNAMSDLEIQMNYREQLQKLNAEITASEDAATWAKIPGNPEIWIHVASQESTIWITVVRKVPFVQTLTAPGGNDYPYLGHLPNYNAESPQRQNFDKQDFKVEDGGETRTLSVAGTKYSVTYTCAEQAKPQSDEAIQKNYRNALKALNAEILFTDEGSTVARFEKDGKIIWVSIQSQEATIWVTAIEEKNFASTIQNPSADAMKSALDSKGFITLHLNFDFNKATLKSDAAPVIAEVVTLLKNDASLQLSIEGHTDNIGGHDYNLNLSQERAAAVADAVVKAGISADRLSSSGFGFDKPIADNNTEEGRAKNRRVELVKKQQAR